MAEWGAASAELGGRQPAVAGDEQHPANGGALCVKGSSLLESLAFLTACFIRAGWAAHRLGEGLDTLAERLAAIMAESGPEAIGIYLSGPAHHRGLPTSPTS